MFEVRDRIGRGVNSNVVFTVVQFCLYVNILSIFDVFSSHHCCPCGSAPTKAKCGRRGLGFGHTLPSTQFTGESLVT